MDGQATTTPSSRAEWLEGEGKVPALLLGERVDVEEEVADGGHHRQVVGRLLGLLDLLDHRRHLVALYNDDTRPPPPPSHTALIVG